jgi:L-asparaginase/Glu-tRNA(Gln) amidotransferase subunit D
MWGKQTRGPNIAQCHHFFRRVSMKKIVSSRLPLKPIQPESSAFFDTMTVVTTGGTIACPTDHSSGKSPQKLNLPEMCDYASKINTVDLYKIDSSQVTFTHWNDLIQCVDPLIKDPHTGIVITHGTDTLALTSYMLHVRFQSALITAKKSLFLTGAMSPFESAETLRRCLSLANRKSPGLFPGIYALIGKTLYTGASLEKVRTSTENGQSCFEGFCVGTVLGKSFVMADESPRILGADLIKAGYLYAPFTPNIDTQHTPAIVDLYFGHSEQDSRDIHAFSLGKSALFLNGSLGEIGGRQERVSHFIPWLMALSTQVPTFIRTALEDRQLIRQEIMDFDVKGSRSTPMIAFLSGSRSIQHWESKWQVLFSRDGATFPIVREDFNRLCVLMHASFGEHPRPEATEIGYLQHHDRVQASVNFDPFVLKIKIDSILRNNAPRKTLILAGFGNGNFPLEEGVIGHIKWAIANGIRVELDTVVREGVVDRSYAPVTELLSMGCTILKT